jgi:UDP-N-acetylmuramate dehydrogenase
MMFSENISLRPYNTFGIDVLAKRFAAFDHADQLPEYLDMAGHNEPLLILGGGSNLLFTGNFNGSVLKNNIRSIRLVGEDDRFVYLQAGAGENWHQFVMYCIERNLGGVENLSLIPGNVGASPMQNIGAYGVEIKDVFHSLEAYDITERRTVRFGLNDCAFGYRDSVFKKELKNRFVILNVTFRLSKSPVFNTSYGAIREELEKMGITSLSIRAISQAVINIRQSKLPDPAVIGNAGSFFKNPEVPESFFISLKQRFPGIVGHVLENGMVKLAAGWLIEQLGWKGYRKGDAGCHARQALVLVNHGNAQGKDIYNLSEQILRSVKTAYGVLLEREVNIV